MAKEISEDREILPFQAEASTEIPKLEDVDQQEKLGKTLDIEKTLVREEDEVSKSEVDTTLVDGESVDVPQAENHQAESSILEPSFTVLKGSKKMAQIRRLERGLAMKRKRHFCCRTCVKDGTHSLFCSVLEDRLDVCHCQHVKDIKKDDVFGIVGDKDLVYMENVRATSHGNEVVMYEDVPFTGEVQACTVCLTDIGHRYLGTVGRCDGREMVRSDATGEMMLMSGPVLPYFLLDRKKLKIVKVTFSKAAE